LRQAQSLIQSRKEKVFTPHDALIDPELFAFVINPVLKDSLPTGGLVGQEFRAEQCTKNYESIVSIIFGF